MRLFRNSTVAIALIASFSVRAGDEKRLQVAEPPSRAEKKQQKHQRPAPKEALQPAPGKQRAAVKPDPGSKPAPCEEVKPFSIE